MSIHPTATVEAGARLGADVHIEAFCLVGEDVELGDGCYLHSRVSITGHTRVGPRCEFFPGAIVGCIPQDLKYRGELSRLEMGERNVFRELVTVHPGTTGGGSITRIGDGNLFLVGAHIAHDCTVGDGCILANYAQLAGHVVVEDYVTFGGQCGVHHFVSIGKHAFIGGMTPVTMDVPPFMVFSASRSQAQGSPIRVRFVNRVGLQRHGFAQDQIGALTGAYMRLYSRRARAAAKSVHTTVDEMLAEPSLEENVEYLCRFLKRTFAHGRHGRYLESLRRDRRPASSATSNEDPVAVAGDRPGGDGRPPH